MVFVRIRQNNQWKDIRPKIYHNKKWQEAKTRIRQNGKWVDLVPPYVPTQRQTTWSATWTGGYWSEVHNNVLKPWTAVWSPDYPVQGSYNPFHDTWDWGNEGGMIGFDDGNIRWMLSGARIDKVEVYLYSEHWAYQNGGQAVIGTHNHRGGRPGRFSEANHGVARARYTTRKQGQWITLPNWVGDNFKNNLLSGITVKADGTNIFQYGVFARARDGWKAPKLRITYTK